jgi:ribonuclease BN (tRNA processing enzyme)
MVGTVSIMQLTVLGGSGAWPDAGGACSGYLVVHDGFRLLVDPGYAVLPRLLELLPATAVDAVFVSHGHPDHCADLNPLLRARALVDEPAPPLPVYALPGALDAVLALDRPGMLDAALDLQGLVLGQRLEIGPFRADIRLLPHSRPNVGIRLVAGGRTLAYTGDCGDPDPGGDVAGLAREADVFLAEATFVDEVPEDSRTTLSSARQAGRSAAMAGVGHLLLTHLMPGVDPEAARGAATTTYSGHVDVARPHLVVDV